MPDYLSDQAHTAEIFAAAPGTPDATRADRVKIAVFGVLRYTAATAQELAHAISVEHDDPEFVDCLRAELQDAGSICRDEATDLLHLPDGPGPADRPQTEQTADVDEPAAQHAAAADATVEDLHPDAWWSAHQSDRDLIPA